MDLYASAVWRKSVKTVLVSVLLGTSWAWAGTPGTMQTASLDSGWEFRQRTEPPAQEAVWRPAEVPGVVHTDLLRNKLIPDPFYRDNEAKLQWIENASWEYRSTFQASPELLQHKNLDIVFDGLDSYAEVYLNGQHVLTADNAFRQWRVDVKALLRPGANRLLVVFPSPIAQAKIVAAQDPWRLKTHTEEKTYIRKPAYEYGWDWGPRFVTSGIWKPVRLEAWNEARIADFNVNQPDVTREVAHLEAQIEIQSSVESPAGITIAYQNHGRVVKLTQQIELHPGLNPFKIPFAVEKPELWYPAGYGSQPLYTFSAEVKTGKQVADSAKTRTGLRSVVLRREKDQWGRSFEFIVNGIPVFAKGADVIPFDSFPTRVTTAQYRRILESAREANMNMVRHWGGGYYETEEFYDLCDELGIMVWQDFMFGNDWQPGTVDFRQNVEKEAEYQVRRLRHHPSIVLWCGNNETEGAFHWAGRPDLPADVRIRMWQDYLVLFSGTLARVVDRLEPELPYWPSSPSSDYEDTSETYQSGDMHNWNIWHGMEPLRAYENYFPRFMTEYGFQSFPEMKTVEEFTQPVDRTSILTPVMLAHQKNAAGNQKIHEYMLRDYPEPKDFASFLYVSQVLQAEAIKIGAEHLRRIRPRAMGSLYWQLNDCWPVASWSSIDYFGRWKALQYYARRFYNDVLVSPHEEDGGIAVYVVSDRTQPLNAELTFRVMTLDGKILKKSTQSVQVPALSSKIYLKIPREELLNVPGADPATSFVAVELSADGKAISRNDLYFLPAKEMPLIAAKIDAGWEKADDQYHLTLSTARLARSVHISFPGLNAQPSDDYFDLLPGEAVTISVRSGATLEQLQAGLKLMSLGDAFAPQTATAPGRPAP